MRRPALIASDAITLTVPRCHARDRAVPPDMPGLPADERGKTVERQAKMALSLDREVAQQRLVLGRLPDIAAAIQAQEHVAAQVVRGENRLGHQQGATVAHDAPRLRKAATRGVV